MASVRSGSPPPSSPPSASNSENSATSPTTSHTQKPQVEGATNNGGTLTVDEKEPDLPENFEYLDSTEYIERFKKYEADYTCRLMAKYFSKKNLYGGNIYDGDITIDDEVIKSSRWPCTRSYADPVQGFEDQRSRGSAYSDESPTTISNGKHPLKKNG
ncbi:uncharacterized protein LOC122296330 [Carya illinoinensis]|uniref:Uncharacterized protein n=1 Tax=Carya illinoinensis TaxID=32201 RepID=A0A8T1NEJ2_CARIL|nr:uncharacterized protein LOC122296330 [Carya illinoinensis]KAG6627282.1 hypothetical protein CIPAW_15G116100 [Carya illinoinensis]KAG6627283.1 hypothetical protein CIPAW_15G116100 [Carya illinoinensis]